MDTKNRQEDTIDKLLSDMRGLADAHTIGKTETYPGEVDNELVDDIEDFANRLESLWKRKIEDYSFLCGTWKQLYDQEHREANARIEELLSPCNAAMIRETLLEARRFIFESSQRNDRDLLINDGVHEPYVLTPQETIAKIDAALADPPRACDIMSEEDLCKVVSKGFLRSIEARHESSILGAKALAEAAISAAIKCAYDKQLLTYSQR